jgi:hypothetical protein
MVGSSTSSGGAPLKRRTLRGIGLGALIAFGGLAAAVYHSDTVRAASYRPAPAIAVYVDGAGSDTYPYRYRVGDQLCQGNTVSALEPGRQLTVYYDPKDVCTSVTSDPFETRLGDQLGLFFAAGLLGFYLWMVGASLKESDNGAAVT